MQTGHRSVNVTRWGAPKLQREATNVIMRLLSMTFERLQQLWDTPDAWKKRHASTRMARRRKYRLVSLSSALWEYPLEAISKHVKVKKVTDKANMDLPGTKHSWATWLPSMMNWLPLLIRGKEWMLLILILAMLLTVFHGLHVAELEGCGLNRWPAMWVSLDH